MNTVRRAEPLGKHSNGRGFLEAVQISPIHPLQSAQLPPCRVAQRLIHRSQDWPVHSALQWHPPLRRTMHQPKHRAMPLVLLAVCATKLSDIGIGPLLVIPVRAFVSIHRWLLKAFGHQIHNDQDHANPLNRRNRR